MRAVIDLPDLIIPSGSSVSNELSEDEFEHTDSISIAGPAALDGTIVVEVANVPNPAAGDWKTLQSGGSDVTITVDDLVVINDTPFRRLRLSSSVSETAERTFPTAGQEAS